MKKWVLIGCAFFVLVVGGCSIYRSPSQLPLDNATDVSSHITPEASSDATSEATSDAITETTTEVIIDFTTLFVELDDEYKKRVTGSCSNSEEVEINYQFAEAWKMAVDEYYDWILLHAEDELYNEISAEVVRWEEYSQNCLGAYESYLYQIYTTGTIVPVLQSEYTYNLYRDKALELYELYSSLQDEPLRAAPKAGDGFA